MAQGGPEIVTLAARGDLAFFYCARAELPVALTALEVWNLMMAEPQPVMKLAFRIRDAISARFGVRRIGGFSGARHETVTAGARLDFFLVERAEPHVLVLTERDRHLDVMTCLSTSGTMVAITSSVITHNLFGRAYMVPDGIAHRLIVRNMLRRLQKTAAGALKPPLSRGSRPASCFSPPAAPSRRGFSHWRG